MDSSTEGRNFSPARSMRAEGRLGEMLTEQKKTVGLNQGAKGSTVTGTKREPVKDTRPTLASVGIDKKLSSRAQKLAAHPPGICFNAESAYSC